MDDRNKEHIFNLMRDQLLRPTYFDNTVHSNYFIKADWSTLPLYRGRNMECRCVLAVLTSTQQLLIYGRKNRRYCTEGWTEPWELLTDISTVYNKHMLKLWSAETGKEDPYELYKERSYELAIIDFVWLPDWKLDPETKASDEVKGVFKAYLLTFHASGSITVWKLVVTKTGRPKYLPVVIYEAKIFMDPLEDVVSTASYIYVTPYYGYLVVGTNKGKLMSYHLERTLKPEKGANKDEFKKYRLSNGVTLWEEDMIRVESIYLRPLSQGRTKLSLFAVKHPNIIIATSVTLTTHSAKSKEFSIAKVPHGTIVGIGNDRQGELLVLHEPGIISLVAHDANTSTLKPIPDSQVSLFDPQKTYKKKAILLGEMLHKFEKKEKPLIDEDLKDSDKRLVFQGLAVSPNKTMICLARTVGMYHDHLQIRKPTQLVFYSLLPPENTWDFVRNIYAENSLSMRAISDVLVPFRHLLRGKGSDEMYNLLLSWALPLRDKSTEDLRLLYWALKLRPKCDPIEWELAAAEKLFNASAFKKLESVEMLHKFRIDVVVDRILQRRFESLIKAVVANSKKYPAIFSLENEENQQSLEAMYTFLESKEGGLNKAIPCKPLFKNPPKIPICYWCKGPLEFPQEHVSYNDISLNEAAEFKTEFDFERMSGYKWNVRRHPVKEAGIHKPEICILSLLPLGFPYRRCTNCHVACRLNPPFGQQPYCPLCNSMMYPSQPAVALEDPEEEMEIKHPISAPKFVKKPAQESGGPLTQFVKVEANTFPFSVEETAEPMMEDSCAFLEHTTEEEPLDRLSPTIEEECHVDIELREDEWTEDAACAQLELLGHDEEGVEIDSGDEDLLARSSDDE